MLVDVGVAVGVHEGVGVNVRVGDAVCDGVEDAVFVKAGLVVDVFDGMKTNEDVAVTVGVPVRVEVG